MDFNFFEFQKKSQSPDPSARFDVSIKYIKWYGLHTSKYFTKSFDLSSR